MIQDVFRCYGQALQRFLPFLTAHLFIRLAVASLLVPIISLALALTLAFSNQPALTDQDIARFLLTPAGFIGAIVILSLLVIALVLDVVVATVILRRPEAGPLEALKLAAGYLLHSVPRLLPFVAHFLLRLLVIVTPFLIVSGGIALVTLTEFDINYYLTERPPAFLWAAGLIGAVLLVMVLVLLEKLSGWAIALHLSLFERVGAKAAFAESEGHMVGHRVGLITRFVIWGAVRLILASAVAGLAAAAVTRAQAGTPGDLEALALSLLLSTGFYLAAMAVINAVANGALAGLLNDQFNRALAGQLPAHPIAQFAEEAHASRKPALVITAVTVLSLLSLATGGVMSEAFKDQNNAQIIAHRGAAALAPENTMASILRAVEDGTDWVEIDVQESADGEIIVVHDSDFMKSSGVATKVWDVTENELAQIDVGSWFDPGFSRERVPRLAEVLEAVRDQAHLLIELKYYGHDEDLEARVADLVIAAGMEDQIATMSLKYPAVQKMLALQPDWRAGVLAATSVGDISGLDGDFLALNQARISPGVVQRAKASGKDVYAWTVNDPATIGRMLWIGVNGLITDDPALAREVMDGYNMLSVLERWVLAMADRISLVLEPENTDALRP